MNIIISMNYSEAMDEVLYMGIYFKKKKPKRRLKTYLNMKSNVK